MTISYYRHGLDNVLIRRDQHYKTEVLHPDGTWAPLSGVDWLNDPVYPLTDDDAQTFMNAYTDDTDDDNEDDDDDS